ncbi:cell surface protein SprA [Flavobacterium cheongpyeongense]|uniref:Cell surface protein SprA n=1 Tax=Flavobacterium cheongpyeongense TaxID=2212651 RepID=A0A2V4BKS4_9FLAO|nr:cell surface protein SprA [Flavobacterium cheongpyeongense]PXY39575.1 cell surface protein SprA [Flavobacterium cheongpyeongense]
MQKKIFFIFMFLYAFVSRAQINQVAQDTVKSGYDIGKIQIANPKSILSSYTYDPITNNYVYTDSVADFSINYPLFLTPAEYEYLILKESRRNYFRKKTDAIEAKKNGSEAAKKDLLPRYYINSGLFESIFGSNTIDIKPTGSVEMDLGLLYSKQDNPALSSKNRSSLTFDFDQRISMALVGKVGTRLSVNVNYDTQSTFAFQNLFKLAYTPDEDDIIQNIEVGNVSMPLNSTLITGAQSLFGVKTQLQFGKTTVTGVFSQQKSETKTVSAEGSGTVQEFNMYALDYDSNRHFFLSQYFRNKYDASLKNYPLIDSRIQISRIEVWVTNKKSQVSTTANNLRNIVAIQDLGESQLSGLTDNQVVVLNPSTGMFNNAPDSPPDNSNNDYDPTQIKSGSGLLNTTIRKIATTASGFNVTVNEGQDYSKLENARKLSSTEYTLNKQLGYISLVQKLANDEILAVAYQYTSGDQVYQVGEFAGDGVDATVVTNSETVTTQSLVLKMLKSSLVNLKNPVWNLMMKNIYQIPNAYQLSQEDFKFNIFYSNPSPLNYISPVTSFLPNPTDENKVAETPLLKVFNLDRLNSTNDPQDGGDGFFDYVSGITMDTANGRIIFTTKEPFGELIFKKLATNTSEDYNDTASYNANQKKYVFRSLYNNTQTGALQDSDKNKYLLKGKYKSSGSDGISIGSTNIANGSVVVTADGRILTEGIDYSVDYQLGKVHILDAALLASNASITVTLENNSVFGQQTKNFLGLNIDHKISDQFTIGATYLKYTEKPLTQKSVYGQESVDNTIFGLNTNFSSEVPFFTRLVNKLPNIDTDIPSNISVRGEVAFLKPNTAKASDFEGESTIYVDDFESAASTIDLRSAYAWSLSSTPGSNTSSAYNFNESATDLSYGFKRAKLAWYTIDPVFYTSKPSGISNDDLSLNSTRRIYEEELYPNVETETGQALVVSTLDLSYYPSERGPYNNEPDFSNNPKDNFGGIMRSLSSTNFEQGNVEYIQFWVLDPYVGNGKANPENSGKLYFNLGEISEDVLKDGRKQYENGLGADQLMVTPRGIWGDVPASQSLTYAFDTDAANRSNQDIGLDGLKNSQEVQIYTNYASETDPAGDDYTYYMNTSGAILERYKNYNGTDGNSAVSTDDANRGSTTLPNTEDINSDYTMNTINAYYEYSVDMKPNMEIGENNITDIRNTQVTLPNGNSTEVRWIQFKIPISQPQNTIGSISDFTSIRFMRMFMTGFSQSITLRFGALDLQRGEWRRYTETLDIEDTDVDDDSTELDVLTVNIEENDGKCPVNYVLPPGVVREQAYSGNTIISQNEQSLGLKVSGKGLEPTDSRAVYKSISMDMRQYKKLKMFLHAESLINQTVLTDNQMTAFIRLGNDYTENFYQIEIPLKVTLPSGCSTLSSEVVWPESNEIDLSLSLLSQLKMLYKKIAATDLSTDGIYYLSEDDEKLDPSLSSKVNKLRLGVKGNPNLGSVRTLMVGIKNNDSHQYIKGEVWFDELRLAEMDNNGGMAAVVNLDTNLADFATISATGKRSTMGFGSLQQSSLERSQEDVQQYNVLTNVNFGKLLPKKWGVNLPLNYAASETIIMPKYDPENPDITLETMLNTAESEEERKSIKNRAIDHTKTTSINLIGIRKDRKPEQKAHIYDIENFTFSQSYNETSSHDYERESYVDQRTNTALNYEYTTEAKNVEPFKKIKFMKKSNYWKFVSDFNFNYMPSNITFNTNIIRQYNKQQYRQVDVEGIPLEPSYSRNFEFNVQYGFTFNLTKSLKLNYTSSSSNIVKTYLNSENQPIDDFKISDNYFNLGEPNKYNQKLVVTYEIPINKIPVFNFVKANLTYTGDYNWQRSSEALAKIEVNGINYNLGNTVQNANTSNLSASFNMETFYKYIGIAKIIPTKSAPKKTVIKPGEKIVPADIPKTNNRSSFLKNLYSVLTSVKNVTLNFNENNGTVLPGYLPGSGFMGFSKPTLGFIFGSQSDIRFEAAEKGWLTTYQEFNQNYTTTKSHIFKGTANLELIPDLKIDLFANRTYSENFSEQYDVSNGQYNSRSAYISGAFSISTVLIKTAFLSSDENSSVAFSDFRKNRLTIAKRLAEQRGINVNNIANIGADGFPLGYGSTNQAVLLASFLAAYTGTDVNTVSLGLFKNIPIPNWSLKYNGLMRYNFFKQRFKRFSLQHSYQATYTVNAFNSNYNYTKNPNGMDDNGNYYNQTITSNVTLAEQFNPFLKVDFELKNSFKLLTQINKDRTLSMSFDNNNLTEVNGIEYMVGIGYRIKDVIFTSRLADNPTNTIKSDIIIKADLTLRDNKTIVRYLDYDNNQLVAGQSIWTLKTTADYSLSKNLTMIFYYNHSFSKPIISTSFPLTTISSGLTIRYTFGN